MPNSEYTRLYLITAALAVGLVLCVSLIGWFDPRTGLFTVAWVALVVTLVLTRPFPYAGWIAVAAGIAAIAAANIYLIGLSMQLVVPVGVACLALPLSALLATVMRRQIEQRVRQHQNDRILIDELRVFDPVTELIRERYVAEVLRIEISRSQRYNKELSVLLIQPANWDELVANQGEGAAEALLVQMSEVLKSSLRDVDVAFLGKDRLGAILRETPVAGTRIVAERLVRNFTRKVRLPARIGIAAFPGDAVTEADLMNAAHAALQVALTASQPVVFYEQVRGAVEPAPEAVGVVAESVPAVLAAAEEVIVPGTRERTMLRIVDVPLGDTLALTQQVEAAAKPAAVSVIEYREGALVLQVDMHPAALQRALVKALLLAPDSIQVDGATVNVKLDRSANGSRAPNGSKPTLE